MPYTLVSLGASNLPEWLGEGGQGEVVWATIFCFGLLFPVSLPRSLQALRFGSLLSFFISIFIVLTIFSLSFRDIAPEGEQKHPFSERANYAYKNSFTITTDGVFNSLPLITFSYMY